MPFNETSSTDRVIAADEQATSRSNPRTVVREALKNAKALDAEFMTGFTAAIEEANEFKVAFETGCAHCTRTILQDAKIYLRAVAGVEASPHDEVAIAYAIEKLKTFNSYFERGYSLVINGVKRFRRQSGPGYEKAIMRVKTFRDAYVAHYTQAVADALADGEMFIAGHEQAQFQFLIRAETPGLESMAFANAAREATA